MPYKGRFSVAEELAGEIEIVRWPLKTVPTKK